VPTLSHLQLLGSSCTYIYIYIIFKASCTNCEAFAVIWSFSHLRQASCSYLKLLAPTSSLLQSFEASSTYLQPLEIFEASNNYIELLAVTWNFWLLFLNLFQLIEASCTYFEPHAIIRSSSHLLRANFELLQLFEASSTFFEPLAIIWSFTQYSSFLKLFEAINA